MFLSFFLRPANIFINGEEKLKIGDFGLARDIGKNSVVNSVNCSFKNKKTGTLGAIGSLGSLASLDSNEINKSINNFNYTNGVGTPFYQSPEQLKNETYNEKVDIYAMGLILYEMCSLFRTLMQRIESLKLLKESGKISNNFKEQFPLESEIIIKMTKFKPKDRPTAEQILQSNEFLKLKSEFEK